jgi:hypothetical protein
MWNMLRASKALFSSPSNWSYMGGFFSCGFFLLLCAVKTTNTHPLRYFFKNVELFEGVKGPLFKPPY